MNPIRPCSSILAWLLAGSLALCPQLCPATDAAASEPWDGAAFTADPAAVAEAAATLPTDEGTDVLVLLDESSVRFDAEGRRVLKHRLVYRVLTPVGLRGWSKIRMAWNPWHQDRPAMRARVISPDGTEHWLDPDTIGESPVSDHQVDVLSDRLVVHAPLPAVAAGAVVEEETVVRDLAPLFAHGTVHYFAIGGRVPVHRKRLVVEAPAGLPLRYETWLLPGVEPQRTQSADLVRLVFEAGPFEAIESVELLAPGDVAITPLVGFSTGESWARVATRYGEIVDAQIDGAELRSIVEKATQGASTRQEKVAGLLAWLQAEVRYTGLEFGAAAIVPRPPAETIQRKYGDCKDKAALLVALLRTAGIPAYLALLNTGPGKDLDPELPGFGAFNHAIVHAPGASELWIDPTSEFARAGELPVGDQGRLALIAGPETTELVATPEAASSENRAVELREIFLAAELGGGRVVETTQAWGSIGRGYRHFFSRSDPADLKEGFDNYVRTVYADLEAAVAAYRKAKELDPDNAVTRQNLAILLEHDREGFRYGPQANLDEAIAEYRSLREELDETGLDENLLIALARSHRFEECTDFAREIDLSPNGYGMLLVAIAATDGPDAAIEEALKLHDRGQRHVALQTAGWVLAVLRRYPESARLLTAAARGAPNAAEILSQADLIRRTRRYEELTLAVGDPRSLVPRTVIALVCAERPDDLLALFGRRLTEARRTEEETAEWEELSNGFRALLQASGMSREAVLDIMLAGLKTTAEGDDSVGYRLRVRWSLDGDESGVLFVGREDGEYRILATDQSLEPIGGEVLRWLEEGEPAAARQWLDWARDETPLPSGDDPFEGSAFPRFWTRGSDGGADEIRYAAASLHADGGEAESAIPILQQGRERAVSDAQRRNFDLALARGFSRLERHTDLLPIARGWLAAKPDSAAAFSYLREALSGLEQGEELRQAAEERLELLPDDPAAIRTLARLAEEQGDLERADRLRRRLVASATAGADDLNHLALNALFQGHVTEQTIEDAQQAAALSQHQDAAYLRTLASIYAEMGKATEAREVILHAMTIGLYDEPKPDDWYVFGRIAEHYGVADAAAQAYRKVEAPERAEDFLSSTYRVAQRRLTALAGELQGESSAERVLR